MSEFFGETKRSKMKCCVPGCTDYYSRRFRFPPLKNKDLIKQWLKNINSTLLYGITHEELYKKYRVCGRHFPEESLNDLRCNRGLVNTAVPVLFLPEHESESHDQLENTPPVKKAKFDKPCIRLPLTGESSKLNLSVSALYDHDKAGTGEYKEHLETTSEIDLATPKYEEPLEADNIPWENYLVSPKDKCTTLNKKTSSTSDENSRVPLGLPSVSSNLKECIEIGEQSRVARNYSDISRQFEDDSNIIIDDDFIDYDTEESEPTNLEYCIEEDKADQFTFIDQIKQHSLTSNKESRLSSKENSDFQYRKEMFKQFVIKIIDEITTEDDLNSIERMFAHVIPLPDKMQENVKS